MAKTLTFDDGLKEYDINGKVTIRFNPADSKFTERLYDVFMQLEARQDEFQAKIDSIGQDGEQLFAYANERDAEMRGIIDGLFGNGVADALFPDMSCYALADGMPVWINFMLAVAEEIESAFDREQKASDPRVRRLSDKNEELLAKYKKATTKK